MDIKERGEGIENEKGWEFMDLLLIICDNEQIDERRTLAFTIWYIASQPKLFHKGQIQVQGLGNWLQRSQNEISQTSRSP